MMSNYPAEIPSTLKSVTDYVVLLLKLAKLPVDQTKDELVSTVQKLNKTLDSFNNLILIEPKAESMVSSTKALIRCLLLMTKSKQNGTYDSKSETELTKNFQIWKGNFTTFKSHCEAVMKKSDVVSERKAATTPVLPSTQNKDANSFKPKTNNVQKTLDLLMDDPELENLMKPKAEKEPPTAENSAGSPAIVNTSSSTSTPSTPSAIKKSNGSSHTNPPENTKPIEKDVPKTVEPVQPPLSQSNNSKGHSSAQTTNPKPNTESIKVQDDNDSNKEHKTPIKFKKSVYNFEIKSVFEEEDEDTVKAEKNSNAKIDEYKYTEPTTPNNDVNNKPKLDNTQPVFSKNTNTTIEDLLPSKQGRQRTRPIYSKQYSTPTFSIQEETGEITAVKLSPHPTRVSERISNYEKSTYQPEPEVKKRPTSEKRSQWKPAIRSSQLVNVNPKEDSYGLDPMSIPDQNPMEFNEKESFRYSQEIHSSSRYSQDVPSNALLDILDADDDLDMEDTYSNNNDDAVTDIDELKKKLALLQSQMKARGISEDMMEEDEVVDLELPKTYVRDSIRLEDDLDLGDEKAFGDSTLDVDVDSIIKNALSNAGVDINPDDLDVPEISGDVNISELSKRLELLSQLEEEWEEGQLFEEVAKLAGARGSTVNNTSAVTQSSLSPEELEALVRIDPEDAPDKPVDAKKVEGLMQKLKSGDDTTKYNCVEQLASLAKENKKSTEEMLKLGFEELCPTFFKTKGPNFLVHVCNIIAHIPVTCTQRKFLASSSMITNLMESLVSPDTKLAKSAEDALHNLSLKNGNLPLILQLLASSESSVQEKAKHKLRQTAAMFRIVSSNDPQLSTPTTTTQFELLEKISLCQLTPAIFVGMTDEHLNNLLPLLVKHTQYEKPKLKYIKNWTAFLNRIQLSPTLGSYFYFIANSENLFSTAGKEGDIEPFCVTKELTDTETFFARLSRYYDQLGPGYSKSDLSLIDPITGKRIKTLSVVEKIQTLQDKPLLMEATFSNNEKGKFLLKKGEDLRAAMYIQVILNVFNELWSVAKVQPRPYVRALRCVPLQSKFGSIEHTENLQGIASFSWEKIKSLPEEKKMKFMGSLAGAYLSAYALGVKERMEEHIFIHESLDVTLRVDASSLWNIKPQPDTFFLSTNLKPQLSTYEWSFFQNLCAEAFKVLHSNGTLIKNLCGTLFQNLMNGTQAVETFMSGNRSLMLTQSVQAAQNQVIASLNTSKTTFKNKMKRWTFFGDKKN
eukprot:TRINITY_DN447_c0_g4_i1.p1 TRINITY_DN447_c0_g4~~TRINITY_DN447_c0_g4_i1.p1  ORF type:complete len:1242 (+),score=349.09 TRINITY_DN447_c0_g4_i1:120-3845(+)